MLSNSSVNYGLLHTMLSLSLWIKRYLDCFNLLINNLVREQYSPLVVKSGPVSSPVICSCRKSCVVQQSVWKSIVMAWTYSFLFFLSAAKPTIIGLRDQPSALKFRRPRRCCTLKLYSCKNLSHLANCPFEFLNLKRHASAAWPVYSEISLPYRYGSAPKTDRQPATFSL